jgi:hypothetical protein
MLPAPQPLAQRPVRVSLAGLGRLLAVALSLVLLLPLAACGGVGQPPRATLLAALALQIELTQDSIAQALRLETGGTPEVSRVRVAEQQVVPIGDGKGLHLSGQFDWRLSGDPIRVDSPFELYLQRGERGESWRLARPLNPAQVEAGQAETAQGEPVQWLIDPLPVKS